MDCIKITACPNITDNIEVCDTLHICYKLLETKQFRTTFDAFGVRFYSYDE
jgi:hypothetical protein